MSLHIGAKEGAIAPSILLPGDPLRAKHIAETFFTNPVCFNEIRGMLGFTGTYKGRRVSVMGHGMGQPSISIYATELMKFYNVQNLIRVGTCGSMQPELKLRDIILAQAACTDSQINNFIFHHRTYAPIADFGLLQRAYQLAKERRLPTTVGNVISSDIFYNDDAGATQTWMDYGVLAVEMEGSALYTLAAKFKRRALMILTVSDSLVTKQETTAEERQKTFDAMIELALDTVEPSPEGA
ncbi:MAG: purine-nucleoside phosphorylase [Spirochaetales bacterium]|jgi:purine-nucleoside phosphorylase|nr:purine-nucleoside phosphorylase [Spirochaetales bacterium]